MFALLALEHLGFWGDVKRIVSRSELITGFPYTFTVPGLPQYLQSLSKLAIAAVWAVAAQAGDQQARDSPISFSQLLESSFPEVRLLTLEALLERFTAAASGSGERGLPPLLWNMGGTFLMLAMKEDHPECSCKVKSLVYSTSPSAPHALWQAHQNKMVLAGLGWLLQQQQEGDSVSGAGASSSYSTCHGFVHRRALRK